MRGYEPSKHLRFCRLVRQFFSVRQAWVHEVFVFTEMKRGEVLGLKWSNIEFEKEKIRISRSFAWTIKSEVERVSSFRPPLLACHPYALDS